MVFKQWLKSRLKPQGARTGWYHVFLPPLLALPKPTACAYCPLRPRLVLRRPPLGGWLPLETKRSLTRRPVLLGLTPVGHWKYSP